MPECESNPIEYNPNWLANAVPFTDDKPNKCHRYKFNHYNESDNLSSFCPAIYFNQSIIERCDKFVYKTDEETILSEVKMPIQQIRSNYFICASLLQFNLTCDENEWKLTLIGTLKMSAELIMLPLSGLLSDRFA